MVKIIRFENKISEHLDRLKKTKGISKTFVANKMQLSRQSLGSLECSDNPTLKLLIKLAYILQCDVTDLYNVEVVDDESK